MKAHEDPALVLIATATVDLTGIPQTMGKRSRMILGGR